MASTTKSFRPRLLSAQRGFLHAVISGDSELSKFYKEWASLLSDIQLASSLGEMQAGELDLRDSIVSSMDVIARHFLQLEVESEQSLCALFDDLALLPSRDFEITAAKWLSSHCHNPYPSKEEKEYIADHTGTSIKRVDSWMTNARKSTGWTTLCQGLFAGSRPATISVAKRVYLGDLNEPNPSPEIAYALFVVKANVDKLYCDAQEISMQLAGVLPVKSFLESDALPSVVIEEKTGLRHGDLSWYLWGDEQDRSAVAETTALDDFEDTLPPPPVVGVKRRCDEQPVVFKRPRLQRASSVPHADQDRATAKSSRRRPSLPVSFVDTSLQLLGPVITLSNGATCTSTELLSFSPPTIDTSSPLRKRRLADVDADGVQPQSKRCCTPRASKGEDDVVDAFPEGLADLQAFDKPHSSIGDSMEKSIPEWLRGFDCGVGACPNADAAPKLIPDFSTLDQWQSLDFKDIATIPASQLLDFANPFILPPTFEPPAADTSLSIRVDQPFTADTGARAIDSDAFWSLLNCFSDGLSDGGDSDTNPPSSSSPSSECDSSEVRTPSSMLLSLDTSPHEHPFDYSAELEQLISSLPPLGSLGEAVTFTAL